MFFCLLSRLTFVASMEYFVLVTLPLAIFRISDFCSLVYNDKMSLESLLFAFLGSFAVYTLFCGMPVLPLMFSAKETISVLKFLSSESKVYFSSFTDNIVLVLAIFSLSTSTLFSWDKSMLMVYFLKALFAKGNLLRSSYFLGTRSS